MNCRDTLVSGSGQSAIFKQSTSVAIHAYKITGYMNKSISEFVAAWIFLCSAVYPSSRVFWGDWLGACEFKLRLHVVASSALRSVTSQ